MQYFGEPWGALLINFSEKPSDFQRRQPSTLPIAMMPTSMSRISSKFDTVISSG